MDKKSTSIMRLTFAAAFAALTLVSCQKDPESSLLSSDAITDLNSGIGPLQARAQEMVPNELFEV